MMKKRLNILISVFVGLAVFSFFLYKVGLDAVLLIVKNINFIYLAISFFFTILTFFLIALRWHVIILAYKKISFLKILKQTIAGYTISYITPVERLGGEPLRAYMLKKEAGIDYKTGISSIIMDKFVELTGCVLFGLFGLSLLLLFVKEVFGLKLILVISIVLLFSVLALFYYRTIKGKGSFSYLLKLLKLDIKFKDFVFVLEDIEKKMESFFRKHKKEFFLSFLAYLIYSVVIILEMKFLLLSFGVNAGLVEIVLALTLIGLVNFIPVPASLGFLEASQSSLFWLLMGDSSIGFALSLLMRIKTLVFIAIGFAIISHFSGKEIGKIRRQATFRKKLGKLRKRKSI